MIAMIESVMPMVFMVIYFGAVIAVIIYVLRLLARIARAIEKIADRIEGRQQAKDY